ncbi:MAG: hypothetical protein K8R39_09505 [Arcobacteraceae bacterium]|nr:hypothetical protein [Arcobacteraceae bacterium]
MKKLFILLALYLPFVSLSANEDSAIANYKKTCKKCHGSAYYVAKERTSDEWTALFENNGKKLYSSHLSDEKAIKKLDSSYFVNRREDLQKFLVDNAKDSGTIPPCNSTTCGFYVKVPKKDKKPTPSLFK